MEKISNIDIFKKKETKIKKEEGVAVVRDNNGNSYLSAYSGEQPLTFEQVMVNMIPFFETFRINEMARPLYVSCVLNAKFSARRLNDAIVSVSMDSTFDKFTPKPGDIVRYDKMGERLFNSTDVINMSECIARIHYNGRCSSLKEAVEKTKELIFSYVATTNNTRLYTLTEYGKEHQEQVLCHIGDTPYKYTFKNNKNEYE